MTPTPKAIENAARAIMRQPDMYTWAVAMEIAQAALSCDLGDMVLVPREATGAMCEVARSFDEAAGGKSYEYRDLYRAMIAAAEGESCK